MVVIEHLTGCQCSTTTSARYQGRQKCSACNFGSTGEMFALVLTNGDPTIVPHILTSLGTPVKNNSTVVTPVLQNRQLHCVIPDIKQFPQTQYKLYPRKQRQACSVPSGSTAIATQWKPNSKQDKGTNKNNGLAGFVTIVRHTIDKNNQLKQKQQLGPLCKTFKRRLDQGSSHNYFFQHWLVWNYWHLYYTFVWDPATVQYPLPEFVFRIVSNSTPLPVRESARVGMYGTLSTSSKQSRGWGGKKGWRLAEVLGRRIDVHI